MINKILVPVDFSRHSKNALELAIFIAKAHKAKIEVLHVIDPSRTLFASGTGSSNRDIEQEYLQHVIETVDMHLKKLISNQENTEGLSINSHIDRGSVLKSIQRQVNALQTNLVVMGTRGVSGLDEFLIGSKTERVVRHSPVPVLVVRERVSEPKFKKIVFASNMKDNQKEALRKLMSFQECFDSELHLLYVNTSTNFTPSADIKAKAQELTASVELKNYVLEIESAYNEENGIIRYANQIDADLIVLATHQRTGISHYFAGSITEDMVNHANRPILTIGLKTTS